VWSGGETGVWDNSLTHSLQVRVAVWHKSLSNPLQVILESGIIHSPISYGMSFVSGKIYCETGSESGIKFTHPYLQVRLESDFTHSCTRGETGVCDNSNLNADETIGN
jgi:hypothetical protein